VDPGSPATPAGGEESVAQDERKEIHMSFLDKVTKAVGDAVDRGKKDLDQYMRIQKINGEISTIESKVVDFRNQIQQAKQEAGAKAIELVKAGSLSCPDLQVFVEKLDSIEQQIAVEQAAIAARKADIEKIKAEDAAAHAAAAAAPVAPPPVPAPPSAATVDPGPVVPPPLPRAATCPQCGKPLTGGAFCTECGAKVS
jgi:hypothetical protein